MSKTNSNKQWLTNYTNMLNQKPKAGDIIYGSSKEDGIYLKSSLQEGEPPFITATLYLPEIVGAELRWMASSSDEPINGISCIIGPRTRGELLTKAGPEDHFRVKSLTIIRLSKSGKSYIVEVNEFFDEPVEVAETVSEGAPTPSEV